VFARSTVFIYTFAISFKFFSMQETYALNVGNMLLTLFDRTQFDVWSDVQVNRAARVPLVYRAGRARKEILV